MAIARCTQAFGQCNIVNRDLRFVRHTDVTLSHWSVYDRAGRMIEDSGFFRGVPEYGSVGGPRAIDVLSDAPCMPEADYFWLGRFQTHFGHFMVGTLSRLWALRDRTDASTRIVYTGEQSPRALFAIAYVRSCFEALGIAQHQLLHVEGPLRFPVLAIAEPAFVENFSASPVLRTTLRTIAQHVLGDEADAPGPRDRNLYLSKALIPSGNRIILNEAELSDHLARRGFEIVHPECLSFPDQLRLWSRARSAIGFCGSAFHTAAFHGKQTLCMVSNTPQASSNQVLLDAISGNSSLHLHAPDSLHEEISTVDGFVLSSIIADPAGLADALARTAEAFIQGRIARVGSSAWPPADWLRRPAFTPLGQDLVPFGAVSREETAGDAAAWTLRLPKAHAITAILLHAAPGWEPGDEPVPPRIMLSADGTDWRAAPRRQISRVEPPSSDTPILAYRSVVPEVAQCVRIEVTGRPLAFEAIEVFGIEPESEMAFEALASGLEAVPTPASTRRRPGLARLWTSLARRI